VARRLSLERGFWLALLAMASCSANEDPQGLPYCDGRRIQLEFVYANKACNTADDCVFAYSSAQSTEWCSGGFFLNEDYDTATWKSVESAGASCPWGARSGPHGCLLNPPPPMCWQGACWPAMVSHGAADACLAELGEVTECSRCVCAQSASLGDCLADPTCKAIFACAVENNCAFNALCAPESEKSPCRYLVQTASAASIARYASATSGPADTGCDILCFPPGK